jgi:diacylglycerol O-acyltransferase
VTSQRMRSADAAWLHMDRPANLMVINSLEWFDTVPDWDAVRLAILERIVGRFERFRQVPESGLLTGARWAVDPSYEPAAHFHRHTLPAPGDRRALSALAGDLATAPLDHRRPLWEVHEIEGYGSGAALLIRVHHAVADGMSLARVMLSASDEAAEPGPGFGEAAHHGSPRASVLSRGLGAALHPRMTAARGLVDAGALAKLLLPGSEASSALQGTGHIVHRVAWSDPVALWRVRNTARAYDVTINDVLIAALSGALRRQLLRAGRDPERLHALIPFNLRPLDEPLSPELGNRFGLVLADLPVELGHPVERVWEAARCMQAIKHSDEGAISFAVLEALGRAPTSVETRMVDHVSQKASMVLTNVPGPRRPLSLAGTPIAGALAWAPCAGTLRMSVSLFSYGGQVTVGFLTDAGVVDDPQPLADAFRAELLDLARRARRLQRP